MCNTTNENSINSVNKIDQFRKMLAYISNFCTDKLVEYQTADDWEDNNNTISWAVPDSDQVARLRWSPYLPEMGSITSPLVSTSAIRIACVRTTLRRAAGKK